MYYILYGVAVMVGSLVKLIAMIVFYVLYGICLFIMAVVEVVVEDHHRRKEKNNANDKARL